MTDKRFPDWNPKISILFFSVAFSHSKVKRNKRGRKKEGKLSPW
jgi:hypothetical protein